MKIVHWYDKKNVLSNSNRSSHAVRDVLGGGVCVCSRTRFKWTRGYGDTPTGRELGAVATLRGHHSAEFPTFLKTPHRRSSSGPGLARTKNRVASRFVYMANENTVAVTSVCCLFWMFFFQRTTIIFLRHTNGPSGKRNKCTEKYC